jgi:hypothetical protein
MSGDPELPPFLCSAAHREDVTEKVKRALAETPMPNVRLFGRRSEPRKPLERVVWVTCSEGHENVFRIPL